MTLIATKKQLIKMMSTLLEADPAAVAPADKAEPEQAPQKEPAKDSNEPKEIDIEKIAAKAGERAPEGNELSVGNVSLDMIIEKLNMVRAGRSLKDAEIKGQMNAYYNELSDPERLALYAFLKGISEVLSGNVQGAQATEPSDSEPKVQVTTEPEKVKKIKPTVVHKGGNKPSKEDTTAPIQVK